MNVITAQALLKYLMSDYNIILLLLFRKIILISF